MKKILLLSVVAAAALFFTACEKNEVPTPTNSTEVAKAAERPATSLAQGVGAGYLVVGTGPHNTYQVTVVGIVRYVSPGIQPIPGIALMRITSDRRPQAFGYRIVSQPTANDLLQLTADSVVLTPNQPFTVTIVCFNNRLQRTTYSTTFAFTSRMSLFDPTGLGKIVHIYTPDPTVDVTEYDDK